MGQVRHGSATTTHAVRAAIQRSQASLSTLSRELGINPKTVAKWRKRTTVQDLKTGPKAPRSTTLTEAEEAAVVAFRRHILLPLDDCLYALQPSMPHLTRSALHRCTAAPLHRCTAACSVMAYPVCRTLRGTSRSDSAASATLSVSSTWTSLRGRPPRARLS
jgi:hypothetical protein